MQSILSILEAPGKTLLCMGPLSSNIIAAAADFSQRNHVPIVLVASRRQIDAAALGGGYVNNWTTEQYVQSIRQLNRGEIFLARDHGGPGQGDHEQKLPANQWMESAKKSYAVDIDCGMDFLHLDPSLPFPGEAYSFEKTLGRVQELYGFVQDYAAKKGKKIAIEVGTEEHTGLAPDIENLRTLLSTIHSFCTQQKLPKPLFVVSQTGTRVQETKNVGVFELPAHSKAQTEVMRLIREASRLTREFSCYLKEHNTDYLSTQNLAMRPPIGIKAANVAPEFGVTETKSLLHLMRILGCESEMNEFSEIVLASRRWEKWLGHGSTASNQEKVLMAGHYCFSDPKIQQLKEKVSFAAHRKGIALDEYLQQNVYASISRFAAAFGLMENQ